MKKAIIIGAGPAGLTAAYELLKNTDIKPIVFEASPYIGGISKTINYKGNRIDIGGHRFFSKSDRVMKWWLNIFPLQGKPSKDDILLGRKIPLSSYKDAPDPERDNEVMLIRKRISRIYFSRHFFDYPISLNLNTLRNLGMERILKIGMSYLKAIMFPIKPERSLEDFFINRFGKELYKTFFKSYTEKVWGTSCKEIKPEWGAQRIKGLSVGKALLHFVKKAFMKKDIEQKNLETSLIEWFMYPKYGPGQLWEEVAKKIVKNGGEVNLNFKVVKLLSHNEEIKKVVVKNTLTGLKEIVEGDYIFSSMPIRDLIDSFSFEVPNNIKDIASNLPYRDFITVGILLKKLLVSNQTRMKTLNNLIPDNWIYIQEKKVKLGRIQIFNNWSPYLVRNLDTVWIGLEYFCNENDELWSLDNEELFNLGIKELSQIGLADRKDVIDWTVLRTKKAYPAYFGTYERIGEIRNFLNNFQNLFLIGRNGLHRYNNQDHSMLTAMTAVDNIVKGIRNKDNIWEINAEKKYHEEGKLTQL